MDIGFAWQGFGSKGAIGMASLRISQKLLLHPTDPGSDGSEMNPPLAKAEPISDSDSSSGTMYLKKGIQKLQHSSGRKALDRICERNNFADIKVSAEGGAGGAPGIEALIPPQPWCRPW